jgi:hypothetical protein
MVYQFRGRYGLIHGQDFEQVIEIPRSAVAVACGRLVARSGQTSLSVDCEECLEALGIPLPEPLPPMIRRDWQREAHNRSVSDVGGD